MTLCDKIAAIANSKCLCWKTQIAENVILKMIGQNWWFGLSGVRIYWINVKAGPQTFEDHLCCSAVFCFNEKTGLWYNIA